MNATIEKFGYPATLVHEYRHWVLLVRPAQVTAGSLILASKSDLTAYGDLPSDAFSEQGGIVAELERMLRSTVKMDKINYLMLMMVDPHVHFHVFPRYHGSRSFVGLELVDRGWPGPPDLKSAVDMSSAAIGQAVEILKSNGYRPDR